MKKAILRTLIYADIFDYPLKIWEIHKWLIGPPAGRAGRKATLRQVERALKRLNQESRQRRGSPKAARIKNKASYYFLPKKGGLISKRQRRQKQSIKYLRKAQVLTSILKLIPWIKLVGISGGLAMDNANKTDDIDLFVITSKNRLWISRILALGLLSLTGQRRKAGDFGREIAGKLCLNILLEEDRLEQSNKDIYLAHEVLQMKVLWERDGVYSKYLEDNSWAFKFLPNWVGNSGKSKNSHNTKYTSQRLVSLWPIIHNTVNFIEILARKFQLWYMESPKGMERIENGALYFHPHDCRQKVLVQYRNMTKKIISVNL